MEPGTVSKLCRHYRTWLIADGYYEWCYECGALRGMKMKSPTVLTSRTYWQRPVGVGGENPIGLKILPGKE